MKKRLPFTFRLFCLCLLTALFSCRNHPSTVILRTSLGEMTVALSADLPEEALDALNGLSAAGDSLTIDRILHDGFIRIGFAGAELPASSTFHPPVSGSLVYCRGYFYLVQGRRHTDASLDRWEQLSGRRIAPEAREQYKQTGGALSLDGQSVIVGTLRRGREALDRIAALPSDGDGRPLRPVYVPAEIR